MQYWESNAKVTSLQNMYSVLQTSSGSHASLWTLSNPQKFYFYFILFWGKGIPVVLRAYTWLCTNRSFLAVLGEPYMVLGIKLLLAICKTKCLKSCTISLPYLFCFGVTPTVLSLLLALCSVITLCGAWGTIRGAKDWTQTCYTTSPVLYCFCNDGDQT